MTAIDGVSDADIAGILGACRRIALVGASANPGRPSFGVMAFLLARGHEVTPVNPGLAGQMLQGCQAMASLADAAPLEMVDVFRAADAVGPVVDDAIAAGARVLWMQLGVINHPAAERARKAGLVVVMDRCPVIEVRRLGLKPLHPAMHA